MRRLLTLLPAMLIALWAQAQSAPTTAEARQTFADLAKLPLAYPEANVEIAGTRTEDGLSIEDVSWESLDGERAPAFVIRPERAVGRLPAIICLHGSSGSRESMTTAQFGPGEWQRPGSDKPHRRMLGWARELSRRGFVTLSLTQRGLDRRGPPINTQSNVLLTQGRTGMGAVLHEIRQAVTYLAGRPDVDPDRIGATGMSFGGITSFYLWVIDDRVAAAAPICGGVGSVDVFARKGRISYHGAYWWLPNMLDKGDQAWFAAALAPRPLMLWAPTEDVGMPKEGVDRFLAAVRPAYAAAGKASELVAHQPPGVHSFTMDAFEAMFDFFAKRFEVRAP